MIRTAIAGIALSLFALGIVGCGRPPQIGGDKETFKTVDALYTAVSLRDAGKVDQCAAKLKSLRDADKLPEAASRSLDAIIAQTKDGQWEPALEQLSTFMEGQSR